MMRVGDRDGEGVGGIRPGDFGAGEQARDHRVDLRLLGVAVADHRFLDQPRGIFANLHARAGSDHQDNAASLAELERRLRVLVDEHFLDGRAFGRMIGDQGFELRREMRQALRQSVGAIGLQLTVGDVAEPIALGLDQAPARGAEPRIEPEDLQASRSSSSSGTS